MIRDKSPAAANAEHLRNDQCRHCGAVLGLSELAAGQCPYCSAALPHHVRAMEVAAAAAQLLADRNANGVPDILENRPVPTHQQPRAMGPEAKFVSKDAARTLGLLLAVVVVMLVYFLIEHGSFFVNELGAACFPATLIFAAAS